MKCLGLLPLKGSTFTQTSIFGVLISVIAIGFHGHDGAGATEFVVVLDSDDTLFGIQQLVEGPGGLSDPSVPSTASWIPNVRDVQREGIIQSKLLVGI